MVATHSYGPRALSRPPLARIIHAVFVDEIAVTPGGNRGDVVDWRLEAYVKVRRGSESTGTLLAIRLDEVG